MTQSPSNPLPSRLRTGPIRCFLVLLACAGMSTPLPAAEIDPGETFDAANRLYELAGYAEAIEGYEALAASGHASANLFFNLGNACYKNGQLGRAVLNYRRAQMLEPRNPDIDANLRFALGRAANRQGTQTRSPLKHLTADEWTWCFSAVLSITLILLAAGEAQTAWRPSLRKPVVVALLAALGTGAIAAFTTLDQWKTDSAIVVVDEAVVRFGPLDESRSAFTLAEGAEVRIVDRKDDWLKVLDPQDRSGWLQGSRIARIDWTTPR